jgi:hypothetical protein
MGTLSSSLQPYLLGSRVAAGSLLSGIGAPGPCGGRKAFASLLLREVELEGAGTWAGALTASTKVNATAIIVARIVNCDERLNQAIIKVFFSKTGYFDKNGRPEL